MSVPTITVLSDGRELDPGYELVAVDVIKEVNRIPVAQLVLIDGDVATATFPISDSGDLDPGRLIEIKLRYEGQRDTKVFSGLVVRHGVATGPGGSQLVIEAKDASIKLAQLRRSAVFRDRRDDEVIAAILDAAGVEAGPIEGVDIVHPELVQYRVTDWDFILSRAEAIGMLVVAEGQVSVRPISVDGEPLHDFEYGLGEIYDFEHEVDGTTQPTGVEARGWDRNKLRMTRPATARSVELGPGDLRGAGIARSLDLGTRELVHGVALEPAELKAWADGSLVRSRLAMIRGRITVAGRADIQLLDTARVAGMGVHFNGTTIVTGVRHRLDDTGWRTDVQFGLDPEILCSRYDVRDMPAGGILPAATALQFGVVAGYEDDPDGDHRIRVHLPMVDGGDKAEPIWARLSQLGAGEGRGLFFRPEPGDEVIVGFIDDDPRRPVVLGALYGPMHRPPAEVAVSENNDDRALVGRSGARVHIVDSEKPKIVIRTPAGNEVVLDDENQVVRLSDSHGNTITMDDTGVMMKSIGDLTLEAAGDVQIKGKKVDLK